MRARPEVLRRYGGECFYCAQPLDLRSLRADHIVPWIKGGTDDPSNLVAACDRCNNTRGDASLMPTPTIAVTGEIAAGKTTLTQRLHDATGWRVLAIDDYRARMRTWDHLVADLEQPAPMIVESVAIPRTYRLMLIRRCALLAHVTCPEPARQERLTDRAGVPRDRFYKRPVVAHATVPGYGVVSSSVIAGLIASATRRGNGPSGSSL